MPTPSRRRVSSPTRSGGAAVSASRRRCRFRSLAEEIEAGLIAWCAQAGRRVLQELWEADVEALCGQRWRPRPRSRVARAGWCYSEIAIGGERAKLRRPRVRSHKGREVELPSYRAAAERDLLDRDTVEAVVSAITTGSSPGNLGGDRIGRVRAAPHTAPPGEPRAADRRVRAGPDAREPRVPGSLVPRRAAAAPARGAAADRPARGKPREPGSRASG